MAATLRIINDTKQAAELVCSAKDANSALLFAYIIGCGGCAAMPKGTVLGISDSEIDRAKSLLVLYGVCCDSEHSAPPRREIEYTAQDLQQARSGDTAFAGLCKYYETTLGRILRRAELEILYSVYDSLGLPAEVLMLLINSCSARGRLTARELEKQAYKWSADGVRTYAQAEKYLDELATRNSKQSEIMRLFGIYDRKLSESEQKLITKWITYGYDKDLIAFAYDKTVLRTGALKWAYLDTILESWREAGYKNRAEVEKNDMPPSMNTDGQTAEKSGEFEAGIVAVVTRKFTDKRKNREQIQDLRLKQLRAESAAFAENERSLRMCASRVSRAAISGEHDEITRLRTQNEELLRRRREILRVMGYDENYVAIIPECPKCRDMGYVGTQMCTCFHAACLSEQEKRHAK